MTSLSPVASKYGFVRQIAAMRVAILGTVLILTYSVVPAASATPLVTLSYVRITNVRDAGFVITWTTDAPANGVARCYNASGALVKTGSDSVSNTTTHYVSISGTGINALTIYRCEVESGGVINNNGSAYFEVTTGPSLSAPLPSSNTVYGYIYQYGGTTPAASAIMFLQIVDTDGTGSLGRSQWVVARAASNGVWYFNLDNARTADLAGYFSYTPGVDSVEVWAQGGQGGTWGLPLSTEQLVAIPATLPGLLPNAVLNGAPLAVTLAEFYAVAHLDYIAVIWETASELNTRGFNLWRGTTPSDPDVQLNSSLIPSQSQGNPGGFTYTWEDRHNLTPGETYYYWLDEVEIGGAVTRFGPVSVTYAIPTAVRLNALDAGSSQTGLGVQRMAVLLVALGLGVIMSTKL